MRVVLALLVCCACPARAESSSWVVRHFTTNDGLPVGSVTDIALGKQGFLWTAGYDGLARFDGSRFRTYDIDRYPLLPSNRAIGMVRAASGEVYIWSSSHRLARISSSDVLNPAAQDDLPADPVSNIQRTPLCACATGQNPSHSGLAESDGWPCARLSRQGATVPHRFHATTLPDPRRTASARWPMKNRVGTPHPR